VSDPAAGPDGELQRLLLIEDCRALLAREARLLDERRWDEWLALYTEDCEYWVPSWHADRPTDDPRSTLSLLYYDRRSGLEERVWRITSGLSAASNVLPRTTHLVASVEVIGFDAASAQVRAAFTCHNLRAEGTHTFFGLYDHTLRRTADGLRIARKRTVLMNDLIPGVLDIYSI
jgi:3-phenylpropionate/cinnamic acid dioxygenase small subunit